MRKKNKLYTANKWNQPLFMAPRESLDARPKNLFALGDQMEQEEPTVTGGLAIPGGLMSGVGISSITPKITGTITGLGEGIKGLGLENNNFNFGNAALGAASGVTTALSPMINKWITNGYETNGTGQTITAVGNALGDAAEAIPVIGKFLGPGVKLMSGVFGGLYNRSFGIKENAENIAAVKNNTAVAQNAAAGFNSAATTNDVLDLSRNMTSSLGLSGDDLYKGGWAKSAKRKAGRKANKLTNLENAGLAMQGVGLATGADNVMNNQYDDVMSKSFADGGYLPFDMISTPNMGAIDYGLKYDYLNMKNNQINAKNSNNIFAIGGDMQTNGADWPTGLTHIEAGGSHSENPYEGIQVGVDSEGVPNLVEEGETIFNDYVYSNRIEVPKEAQKWLGVKGKNLTFAEASKQLEKEIKERPNDPVSLASLKVQMERLEKEQEFVKRCTSYSVGEVYDVDNDEISLLNHNGYEYEKLG